MYPLTNLNHNNILILDILNIDIKGDGMAREQLQNLTEPMYYVLLTLTKERYGYEIMQTIDELTNGRVVVGPGTLYALLSRFEKEDIIKQVSDDGRRKNYIITSKGREILEEEINRLRELIKDGERMTKGEKGLNEEKISRVETPIKKDKTRRGSIFKRSRDEEIL